MFKIIICFFILLFGFPFQSKSQSLSQDPRIVSAINLLELWLDAEIAYERIPGISIGVVHDQDLIWSRGFGYANPDKELEASAQTIYSICSISKLFTSIALLQLRDRGLLRLDDPVSKHLSWFKIKQMYPNGPSITIQNILTHSSGLPRESDFPYWGGPDFEFPTREQIIKQLTEQETLYPADTYFQYSNLGMTLAGEIIAQVSGKSYNDYIKENILEPLSLLDTRLELPEEYKGGRLAVGYGAFTRDGTRREMPFYYARGITPAAGFSSTVEDLARFASWQFRLLENGGTEILQANTLREMQRVHWLDPNWRTTRGWGFSIWRSKNKTFVGHGGACPGYQTQFLMQSKDKIATIFMSNARGINSRAYSQRAYEIFAPVISDVLKSPDSAKTPDPAFEKYTGTYTREPRGGEIGVLVWKDKLAMVYFPTNNPIESLIKLKHIEGDRFRRIRDDDELGEEITFGVDNQGKVVRLQRHSNFWKKLE